MFTTFITASRPLVFPYRPPPVLWLHPACTNRLRLQVCLHSTTPPPTSPSASPFQKPIIRNAGPESSCIVKPLSRLLAALGSLPPRDRSAVLVLSRWLVAASHVHRPLHPRRSVSCSRTWIFSHANRMLWARQMRHHEHDSSCSLRHNTRPALLSN